MDGVKFNVIKGRREGYNEQYKGSECVVDDSGISGYYLVSARDSVQMFQNYRETGVLPIFTPGSDTYAVPLPEKPLKKTDYQQLIDNNCKIGYIIYCSKQDSTEVKKSELDGRLTVDYTEKAEDSSRKKGAPPYGGVVYTCAQDGTGIMLEDDVFDLFCSVCDHEEVGSRAYLQAGKCNAYMYIALDTEIVVAYLRIKSWSQKRNFIQKLNKEVNSQIIQSGKDGLRYLFLGKIYLDDMVGCAIEENVGSSEHDSRNIDRQQKMEVDSAATAGTRIVQMMQKFANSSIGVRVGIGGCGCLLFATICVSVYLGVEIGQHKDNGVAFAISCGAGILLGVVLSTMIAIKCKCSRAGGVKVTDVVDISMQNVGRNTD